MIAIIIILILIIIIIGIVGYGIYQIKLHFEPKPLGGSCKLPTDCANANLSVFNPGVTCCNGICLQKKKDHANFWYCPHECVGRIFGQPGTCN